jgi:hypothetical protein
MDWGRVIYVFFALMSLTSTVGFLYDHNSVNLFLAAMVNLISTLLKLGVRQMLSAELLAGSLVADLHLIPSFFFLGFQTNIITSVALAIGAVVANFYVIIVALVESIKTEHKYY